MAKTDRRIIDKVFVSLGSVAVVVLVVVGILAAVGYQFATSTVRSELTSQQIYFPPKGSPALDPNEFPGLQKYAGQLVDNGPKAKAFANEFIAVHLKKVANGQTYSQVSAAALADPTNTALKQQAQVLFQGETLRGLLLGDGYAYWTFGQIAGIVALVTFAGAAVMLLLVLAGLRHIAKQR